MPKVSLNGVGLVFLLFFNLNLFSLKPSQSLNYGDGLIFIPTAHLQEEGSLIINYSSFGHIRNYRISAYPFNWLSGSFFYADINSERYGTGMSQSFKDKGFALKAKLFESKRTKISLGLEDFAGTGHFDSEYLVLTHSDYNFDLTIGFGTGHIAGNSSKKNPLTTLNESFKNRRTGYKNFGGTPEIDKWFRGRIGFFAGLEFKIPNIKSLTYKIEYEDFKNKANAKEIFNYFPTSKLNHGISYHTKWGIQLGLYSIGNEESVFNISLNKNFKTPRKKLFKELKIQSGTSIEDQVLAKLANNGVYLQKSTIDPNNKNIEVEYMQAFNDDEKYATIDTYSYINKEFGFENQKHTIRNGPVYLAEIVYKNGRIVERNDPDQEKKYSFNPKVLYPIFSYGISPGYKNHIGSPAGFIFSELNLNITTSLILSKNIELSSMFTAPLLNNYKDLSYNPAQTSAPPVRIEIQKYLRQGINGPERFHLDYINQYKNNHILLSIGEFEMMYGGLRVEYLYKDFYSNHAIGFNLNKLYKRDYKKSFFEYLDYQALTAHIDYYYLDPKSRVLVNVSYGKYLAKDKGFTFDFSRRFMNGLVLGAFFSQTDMPLSQFGEGSFDKGVYISIPFNNIFGSRRMSKGKFNEVYRPLTRDGAAKVSFAKRLHEVAFYRSINNF